MSKERQRARAARESEQAKARARAAKAAERKARLEQARPSVPAQSKKPPTRKQPVYRQRRFAPLPWRLKVALAVGWLAVATAVVLLVPTWTGRIGFLVIATMLLPLIVVIVRDPTRRYR